MDGNDTAALEFDGLFKRFGDHVAVDHIHLTVPAGSFFGLVGPNEVGKTTSLSMAVGLLRPDGGTVKIFGRDVWADRVAAKALIGVLAPRPGLRHLRARAGHHAAVGRLGPGAVRGQAADRRPLPGAGRRGEDPAVRLGPGGG